MNGSEPQPSSSPNPAARSSFSHYLPRLRREFYQADAVVFWTLPIAHRARGLLSEFCPRAKLRSRRRQSAHSKTRAVAPQVAVRVEEFDVEGGILNLFEVKGDS